MEPLNGILPAVVTPLKENGTRAASRACWRASRMHGVRMSLLQRAGHTLFNGRDEVLAAGLLMGAHGGIGS